jgi:hypothetical protein
MTALDVDPLASNCCQCGRAISFRGSAYLLEYAVNGHAEAEAYEYIETLRNSSKRADRMRAFDLIQRLDTYAEVGQLEVPRELRRLDERFLEIKTACDRVPFFHLGSPHFTVKTARLTHGFEKAKNKTPQGKLPEKQKRHMRWIYDNDLARGDGTDDVSL